MGKRSEVRARGEWRMRGARERYNNLPIQRKLFLIILAALVLFIMACLVGLNIVNHSNETLLYNTLASSLSYSAKELGNRLDTLEALSFNIATDSEVQAQLASIMDEPTDAVVRARAYRTLNTLLQNYYAQSNALRFISIENETISVHTDTVRAQKNPKDIRDRLTAQAIKADGRATWAIEANADNPLFVLRSARRISPYTLDSLGVVMMSVRVDKLVEDSTTFSNRFSEAYYYLASDDVVLYQSANLPKDAQHQLHAIGAGGYQLLMSDGHRYFAVGGTIPEYGWTYVHIVSYDEMHGAMLHSTLLYLLTIAAGLLLAAILCNIMVSHFTVHISALIDKMRDFSAHGQLPAPVAYDYSRRQDEVGHMHRQFDNMAEQIVYLIENDYMNQILMKEARLKALEAQIDPHFLYNVLQSVGWQARAVGDQKIAMMVDALGKMLRTTLSREDEEFTIGKEAEFVKNYMTIQQFRFEGRLAFSMHIPPELHDVRIPKLTIQPLVENSIKYALEENDDELCEIEVRGEIHPDEIWILVKNTGSEYEEDLIEKLAEGEVQPNGFGIGIMNIVQRLRLFGGERYQMELFNEDGWAIARIRMPREGGCRDRC